MQFLRFNQFKGSSINFSAHGWWGKEKYNVVAKNPVRPRKNTAEKSAMRESQSMLLWITVLGFVLHHHPNDVDHVSPQADEGLRF